MKRLFYIFIALLLSVITTLNNQQVHAASTPKVYITKANVELKESADPNSKTKLSIPSGTALVTEETSKTFSGWVYVWKDSYVGWVPLSSLNYQTTHYTEIAKEYVPMVETEFKENPADSAKTKITIPAGEILYSNLSIVDANGIVWVQTDKKWSWVKLSSLSEIPRHSIKRQNTSYYMTKSDVSATIEPNKYSEAIISVKKGTVVTSDEYTYVNNVLWLFIEVGDNIGWVPASVLKSSEPPVSAKTKQYLASLAAIQKKYHVTSGITINHYDERYCDQPNATGVRNPDAYQYGGPLQIWKLSMNYNDFIKNSSKQNTMYESIKLLGYKGTKSALISEVKKYLYKDRKAVWRTLPNYSTGSYEFSRGFYKKNTLTFILWVGDLY